MVTQSIQKKQIILLIVWTVLLAACSGGTKPPSEKQLLVNALLSKNNAEITIRKSSLAGNVKALNLVQLYQLVIRDEPYQVVSNSQILLQNLHHYALSQQVMLKQILLWAYAHPIYRQETGKQVRILQRTELLLAPSNIDFTRCADPTAACSGLRKQIAHIANAGEVNELLYEMANNDPCINLSDENLAGESANLCLASRKGDLKINLLSHPNFLASQWHEALE